jgi:UrcA family protein
MATIFTRFATALALTGAALSVPASAAPDDQAPSISVRYRDLDLASDAGTKALNRRIAQAAQRLYPDADARDLGMLAQIHSARTTAIANAEAQAETALAAARNSKAYAANTIDPRTTGL